MSLSLFEVYRGNFSTYLARNHSEPLDTGAALMPSPTQHHTKPVALRREDTLSYPSQIHCAAKSTFVFALLRDQRSLCAASRELSISRVVMGEMHGAITLLQHRSHHNTWRISELIRTKEKLLFTTSHYDDEKCLPERTSALRASISAPAIRSTSSTLRLPLRPALCAAVSFCTGRTTRSSQQPLHQRHQLTWEDFSTHRAIECSQVDAD